MSDQNPAAGQPEYLPGAPVPATAPGGGKKAAVIGGAAIGVVALAGGGIWAATAFLGSGVQPADALPSSTIAYASIDLDPSGKQKIEAIRMLRKFPAFRDEIGLNTDDDLRRKLFDEIRSDTDCDNLDYAEDVEPWLGERAAVAAVDAGDESIAGVIVIQVKDADAAEAGFTAIRNCAATGDADQAGSEPAGGWAIADGWAVLAESEEIATGVAADAREASLTDDETYQKWTGEVGDAGIVNFYVAPAAGEAMLGALEDFGPAFGLNPGDPFGGNDQFGGDSPFGDGEGNDFLGDGELTEEELLELLEEQFGDLDPSSDSGLQQAPYQQAAFQQAPYQQAAFRAGSSDEISGEVREALEDFKGLAGTLRFDNGAIELAFAGDVGDRAQAFYSDGNGAEALTTLPADTAAAIGISLAEGWFEEIVDQVGSLSGGEMTGADLVAEIEAQTGLDLPADLETLVGESLAVALGSGFSAEVLTNSADGSDVPVGVKIKGDSDQIESVLEKLRPQAGPDGDQILGSDQDGDMIVVGPNAEYRSELIQDGGLGGSDTFRDVVREADDASLVLFVNFGAGDNWLVELVRGVAGDDPDLIGNIEPLSGFGLTAWRDGDTSHSVLRLTTE